jgi:hypothetical protein
MTKQQKIELLRKEYSEIRDRTIQIASYELTKSSFDVSVIRHVNSFKLKPTPENYVAAAYAVFIESASSYSLLHTN